MSEVKIIPITQAYRDGHEAIRWDSYDKRNIGAIRKTLEQNRDEIVYGSDTETGRRTIKV